MDQADNGVLMAVPGFGVHALLTLDEKDVRAEIAHVIEANPVVEPIAITADSVTSDDIRTACLNVADHTDLAEEKGAAVFNAALAAIRQAAERLRSNPGSV